MITISILPATPIVSIVIRINRLLEHSLEHPYFLLHLLSDSIVARIHWHCQYIRLEQPYVIHLVRIVKIHVAEFIRTPTLRSHRVSVSAFIRTLDWQKRYYCQWTPATDNSFCQYTPTQWQCYCQKITVYWMTQSSSSFGSSVDTASLLDFNDGRPGDFFRLSALLAGPTLVSSNSSGLFFTGLLVIDCRGRFSTLSTPKH